jgi:prepilin-type N-terminal cleavage/methylation domain-containing protein
MRQVRRLERSGDSGFTLVEIMVVVLIIGILVGIAVASYVFANRQSAKIACYSNQRILEDTCWAYALDHDGAYPSVMEELRPYITNYDDVIPCTIDDDVLLEYTATANGVNVSCPNHPR